MKKVINLFLSIIIIYACNSTKKIPSVQAGSQEAKLPFSETKYKTDKDYFRAVQVGKSIDLGTAKKMSIHSAKADLASFINTKLKKVTDLYTNQSTVEDKSDFEKKFEEFSREVVNQNLNDVKLLDEKVFKEQDGSYSYWVVLEIDKKALLNGVNNSISKNAKLQLNYDKKKFEEIYNAEMEKLVNDNK